MHFSKAPRKRMMARLPKCKSEKQFLSYSNHPTLHHRHFSIHDCCSNKIYTDKQPSISSIAAKNIKTR